MNNQIVPLFTTDYSIGKSILCLDPPSSEIDENKPVSIFSIVKKYNIEPFFVVENSMTGFIKLYKGAKELNKQFVFGLKLVVVDDINKKDQESLRHESKIVIFCKNSESYFDLIKIFSLAATQGKYYVPRIDWKSLKNLWTKNLIMAVPFYDSFFHVNLLCNGSCIPDFLPDPLFLKERHDLPFDNLIEGNLVNYCEQNGFKMVDTHSCYYFKDSDAQAFQTFKCIHNRSTFDKPDLNHFSSNRFSFESYLKL